MNNTSKMTLGNSSAMPNVAVKNISISKKFYEEILGLEKLRVDPSGRIMYKTGDTALFIYESEFAGTNKADYMAWEVGNDFNEIVSNLESKDVKFEDYSEMFNVKYKDNVHLMGKVGLVWFNDPDGNSIVIAGNL